MSVGTYSGIHVLYEAPFWDTRVMMMAWAGAGFSAHHSDVEGWFLSFLSPEVEVEAL